MTNILRALIALLAASALSASSPAIKNFGQVEPTIYRGAQPDGRGLLDLAGAGFASVLDLRSGNRVAERTAAESLGLRYANFPLNGVLAPSADQISEVLLLIDQLPKPVFIHCAHGQDRTGTVVACYRMAREGWPNPRAFNEAIFYGINPLQLGMRHFIKNYRSGK